MEVIHLQKEINRINQYMVNVKEIIDKLKECEHKIHENEDKFYKSYDLFKTLERCVVVFGKSIKLLHAMPPELWAKQINCADSRMTIHTITAFFLKIRRFLNEFRNDLFDLPQISERDRFVNHSNSSSPHSVSTIETSSEVMDECDASDSHYSKTEIDFSYNASNDNDLENSNDSEDFIIEKYESDSNNSDVSQVTVIAVDDSRSLTDNSFKIAPNFKELLHSLIFNSLSSDSEDEFDISSENYLPSLSKGIDSSKDWENNNEGHKVNAAGLKCKNIGFSIEENNIKVEHEIDFLQPIVLPDTEDVQNLENSVDSRQVLPDFNALQDTTTIKENDLEISYNSEDFVIKKYEGDTNNLDVSQVTVIAVDDSRPLPDNSFKVATNFTEELYSLIFNSLSLDSDDEPDISSEIYLPSSSKGIDSPKDCENEIEAHTDTVNATGLNCKTTVLNFEENIEVKVSSDTGKDQKLEKSLDLRFSQVLVESDKCDDNDLNTSQDTTNSKGNDLEIINDSEDFPIEKYESDINNSDVSEVTVIAVDDSRTLPDNSFEVSANFTEELYSLIFNSLSSDSDDEPDISSEIYLPSSSKGIDSPKDFKNEIEGHTDTVNATGLNCKTTVLNFEENIEVKVSSDTGKDQKLEKSLDLRFSQVLVESDKCDDNDLNTSQDTTNSKGNDLEIINDSEDFPIEKYESDINNSDVSEVTVIAVDDSKTLPDNSFEVSANFTEELYSLIFNSLSLDSDDEPDISPEIYLPSSSKGIDSPKDCENEIEDETFNAAGLNCKTTVLNFEENIEVKVSSDTGNEQKLEKSLVSPVLLDLNTLQDTTTINDSEDFAIEKYESDTNNSVVSQITVIAVDDSRSLPDNSFKIAPNFVKKTNSLLFNRLRSASEDELDISSEIYFPSPSEGIGRSKDREHDNEDHKVNAAGLKYKTTGFNFEENIKVEREIDSVNVSSDIGHEQNLVLPSLKETDKCNNDDLNASQDATVDVNDSAYSSFNITPHNAVIPKIVFSASKDNQCPLGNPTVVDDNLETIITKECDNNTQNKTDISVEQYLENESSQNVDQLGYYSNERNSTLSAEESTLFVEICPNNEDVICDQTVGGMAASDLIYNGKSKYERNPYESDSSISIINDVLALIWDTQTGVIINQSLVSSDYTANQIDSLQESDDQFKDSGSFSDDLLIQESVKYETGKETTPPEEIPQKKIIAPEVDVDKANDVKSRAKMLEKLQENQLNNTFFILLSIQWKHGIVDNKIEKNLILTHFSDDALGYAQFMEQVEKLQDYNVVRIIKMDHEIVAIEILSNI